MTHFLGTVKQFDSRQIGQVMAVPGIAMIISLPLARMFRRRFGGMPSLAIGLAVFAAAFWTNASMVADTAFNELFIPQVCRGLSIILCLSPVTELALGSLSKEAVPNATGLYSLMRSLGGGLGIALINIVVTNRTALHHTA